MFVDSVKGVDMESLRQRVRRGVWQFRVESRKNAPTAEIRGRVSQQSQPLLATKADAADTAVPLEPSLLRRIFRELDPFRAKRLRDAEKAEFWSRLEGLAGDVRALGYRIDEELIHLRNEIARIAREKAASDRVVEILKGDLQFQRRRLTRLDRTGVSLPTPTDEPALADSDDIYLAFEEQFRGPIDEIKRRLIPHLERVRAHPTLIAGRPLLDVGCGRGEWLELLQECTIDSYGIDTNRHVVEACTRRGLEARHAEGLSHLNSLPDGVLGAISIFHVIEHLEHGRLLQFLDEAHRVLVTGGLLVIETPNPENMRVGATTFYNDPTHLRPLPPQLTEFLVKSRGFVDVEIARLNPYPQHEMVKEPSQAAARLNELMQGSQDYAVFARKA